MTKPTTPPHAWQRYTYVALWLVLLALYLIPTLAHLDGYAWDYDEGPYLQSAALANAGHPLYESVVLNKLPFLAWALDLGFALGGVSMATARLVVLLITALGFVSLGLLAELWWGRGAGPVALAVLLTISEATSRAGVVMNDLPAMSLAIMALLGATQFRRTQKWRWAAGCALTYALAVGLHPLLLFLGWPLLWAMTYPCPGEPFDLGRAVRLTALLGGVGCALLGGTLLLVDLPGFVRWVYDYNTVAAQAMSAGFPAGERLGAYTLAHAPLVVMACVAGLLLRSRRQRFWVALTLIWAAMTATALFLYRPLWQHYLILLLYPFIVIAAGGIVAAYKRLRAARSHLGVRALAAVTLALGLTLLLQRLLAPPAWPQWPAGYAELSAHLEQTRAPGEMIASDNQFLIFAAGYPVPPALADTSFKRINNNYLDAGDIVGALLRQDVRTLVLDNAEGRFTHYPELMRAVTAVAEPGPCFGELCVYNTLPLQPLDDAILGESVQLRGFRRSTQEALHAGSTLTVTFYWEPLKLDDASMAQLAEGSIKVFMHLLDRDGQLVAQHDGSPAFALTSAASQPGRVLPDPHPLILPPELTAGSYTLSVGLYRWPSLERLSATGPNATAQGSIEIARIAVIAPGNDAD